MGGGAVPERLEGWCPRIPDDVSLAAAVELAFDYRGDVTVDLADGTHVVGYLFNRDGDAALAELYVPGDDTPLTIRYTDIRGIRFSGRDTAAGNTYAAWLRRREEARRPSPSAPARGGS